MKDERSARRFIFLVPGDAGNRDIRDILRLGGYPSVPGDHGTYSWTWLDTPSGTLRLAGLRARGGEPPGRKALRPALSVHSVTEARALDPGPPAETLLKGLHLVPVLHQQGLVHGFFLESGGLTFSARVFQARFRLPGETSGSTGHRFLELSWEGLATEPLYCATYLRDRLKWVPCPSDWVRIGMGALGAAEPGILPPPGDPVTASEPLERQAEVFIRRQADRMKVNLEGALRDLDPEFIHDIRVATRRSRFVLRLLSALPGSGPSDPLRAGLRWVARSCGAVRDLDILTLYLRENLPLMGAGPDEAQRLLSLVRDHRGTAWRRMARTLRSIRFRDVRDRLSAFRPAPAARPGQPVQPALGQEAVVAPGGGPPAGPPDPRALAAAVRDTRRAAARVCRAGRRAVEHLDPAELHRVRILFKRLRYTAEFYAPWIDPVLRPVLPRIVAVQDCLGTHQDCRCALALLGELGQGARAGGPSDAPPDSLSGALAERLRLRALGLREQFLLLWKPFPGILRCFQQGLERLPLAAPATPGTGLPPPPAEKPWVTALRNAPGTTDAATVSGAGCPPPVAAEGTFETVAHTADLALALRGKDFPALLHAAVAGVRSLLVAEGEVRARSDMPFQVEGESDEDLLWRLMNEILFLFDARRFLVCSLRISALGPGRLEGALEGEGLDPDRHVVGHLVKAATSHNLAIRRGRGGLETVVVLDV
ncbi:MAG: archease [Acidobacteria bacterium]|nr:archease [Acidobacteriota bacterium]